MAWEIPSAIRLEADKEVTDKLETFCLIGKLILKRILNKQDVKCITSGTWECKKDYLVSEIEENTFMFSFQDRDD